jgi:hypothetical protein
LRNCELGTDFSTSTLLTWNSSFTQLKILNWNSFETSYISEICFGYCVACICLLILMIVCNTIHKVLTSINYFLLSLVLIHFELLCLVSIINITVYEFWKCRRNRKLKNSWALNTPFMFCIVRLWQTSKTQWNKKYTGLLLNISEELQIVMSVYWTRLIALYI